MKKTIYLLLIGAFILPGCTTTSEKTDNPIDQTVSEEGQKENAIVGDELDTNKKDSPVKGKLEPKEATKEECDKINIGMSTDEVKGILGEPFEKNESKSSTGKTEFWSYQDAGTFSQVEKCHFTFNDGLVFTTNWFDPK